MTNDVTSECTVEKGPAPLCEPRIRWRGGDGYALVELGRHGLPAELPGRRIIIGDCEMLGESDTLILSERCGGSRDLLSWWRSRLDQAGRPWALVHAADWASDFFEWGEAAGESDRREAAAAIEGFGLETGRTKRAQALLSWSKALNEPFTLIIRDLMSMDRKQGPAIEAATALRTIRDRKLAPNLQIVLLSHSETIFVDLPDHSGYLALLRQFRMPTLNAEEIALLAAGVWEETTSPQLVLSAEALAAVLDHTGGQPLLVQHFLRLLREPPGPARERAVAVDDVHRAARKLRESPPDETAQWQRDFHRMIENHPDLVRTMEAYVVGTSLGPSRFPPPRADRALFIAGWVGLNRLGRWGIASAFHAHLARPVLDEFRRGES